jgi:KUP system potassium uptake protein
VTDARRGHPGLLGLSFGTLGIVFGDIGTSPIYAIRESFEHSELTLNHDTAYGIASVVFWALWIVIAFKYLTLVMRADHNGEGGILALTALVLPERGKTVTKTAGALIALGVFGTALLYGDGLITPAISVLSAVEGFEVATSAFSDWVIPVSIVILVGLFAVQKRGTAGIAKVFSPVMVVWFVVIGLLGVRQIANHPEVLKAVSPTYAVQLFADHPWRAFLALGSVFLVVTGGEALYADMGHFGRKPIAVSWYTIAMPALLLNYFGQAALLADGRHEVGSPFYEMAPDWAITPLAILATMATVIASQALISGAYSLTVQAMQLDYIPRLSVVHTSPQHIGQVYVPLVNWLLMIGCVGLVIAFRTSGNLAAAYGIAVTTTMLITTLIFYRVVRDKWQWPAWKAVAVLGPLMLVDAAFLGANIPKIPEGGWFPLLVGFGLVIQMTTWNKGRQLVAARIRKGQRSAIEVVNNAVEAGITRVPGTAVYLCKDPAAAPAAVITNLRHNKSLHTNTIFLSVSVDNVPRVANRKRAHWARIGHGVLQLRLHFGYMEDPDVATALERAVLPDDFELGPLSEVTYFLGKESVEVGAVAGMHPLREQLFVLLDRGAASAARFFRLPPDQVVEVGTHVVI